MKISFIFLLLYSCFGGLKEPLPACTVKELIQGHQLVHNFHTVWLQMYVWRNSGYIITINTTLSGHMEDRFL